MITLREKNIDLGAGVLLNNVITLRDIDLNKFKALARNWKISGVNYVVLDSELGFSQDILNSLNEAKLDSWINFESNPEPAQLRFLASQGVKVVIAPASSPNEMLNLAGRVHRCNLLLFAKVKQNSSTYPYNLNNISQLRDSEIDGIVGSEDLDFQVLLTAFNSSIVAIATNANNFKDVYTKKMHGGASYLSAVNPKLIVDALIGDVVAQTEIAQRGNLPKDTIVKEIFTLIKK